MAAAIEPSNRQHWFAELDAWHAGGRPFREIADWLTGERGLSTWWAQKLIVEYEQARGLREPGVRRDGTFSAGASRTINAPVARVELGFVDPVLRSRWLPGVDLVERGSRPGRSVRFDVGGDGTRLTVQFLVVGSSRSQVAVEEQRIPGAAIAAARRAFWRDRLALLASVTEGESR